jgi:hypothetical protein
MASRAPGINRGPVPGTTGSMQRDWQHVAPDGITRGKPLPAKAPSGKPWNAQTKSWWEAVRRHPVASTWDPVQWAEALTLAGLRDSCVADSHAGQLAEARRRSDELGLSVAGRARLKIALVEPGRVPLAVADASVTPLSDPTIGRRVRPGS